MKYRRPYLAFAYQITRSVRNRLVSGVKKLKQPRYLIGSVAAAAYIWWFFINPITKATANMGTPADGMIPAQALAIFLAYMQFLLGWVIAPFSQGIPFTEAEVQRLFPAPLMRRDLLLFRWMREQPVLLLTQALFAVVAMRLGARHYLIAWIGLYFMSNALASHAMVARLFSLWLRTKGLIGRMLSFVPMIVIVGVTIWAVYDAFERGGENPFMDNGRPRSFSEILMRGPTFRVLSRPLFLITRPIVGELSRAWLSDVALVVLFFIVMRIFIRNLDVAFEEQASEMAQKLVRVKTEGLAALAGEKRLIVKEGDRPLFELSSRGAPWVAFVWKNVISIGRFKRRILAFIPVLILMGFVIASGSSRHADRDTSQVIGAILLFITPYTAIVGPALLRIDLRLDLAHFDVLKAMPVRGRQLVLGEVLATTLVLWAAQLLLLAVAATLLWRSGQPWTKEHAEWRLTVGLALSAFTGAAVLLGGIDFVITTAQNLMALYFPSLTRVGNASRQGFDAFGQQLIGGLVTFIGYAVLFVVPGLAVLGAGFVGRMVGGTPLMALAGGIAGGMLLVLEAAALIFLSERRFERYDVSAESVGTE